MLGAANTDPAEFADPDVVDFKRSPNRHRAFGGGPHRCLGSHLARLEMDIALRLWHERIPHYEVATNEPLREYRSSVYGVTRLPLSWSTGG